MSSKVRAIILRNMKVISCIEEALEEMGIEYTLNNTTCVLNNGMTLENIKKDIRLTYRVASRADEVTLNSFVEQLVQTYSVKLAERIRRLKLEELELKEKTTLEKISEEKYRARELELLRERKRLEEINRKEELELKQKIEEKTQQIKMKAELLGYTITEQVKGKEKVLVLVRRV